MERRLISLFTGAGGLDLGFEAAGFETAVAVEFDEQCCETLRQNRNWPVIHDDIANVSSEQILQTSGLAVGEADVLIGGPPCQPFSKSGFWATGDSKRLKDPRASTLDEYLRILEDTLPSAFLIENVAGIGYKGKSEGLDYILKSVHEINDRRGTHYQIEHLRLNAAHFGVPQLRERVFLAAHRDGLPFGGMDPTHQDPEAEDLFGVPFTTVWDAIGHLDPPVKKDLKLSGKWADLLPSIPEGENYLFHTERGNGLELFGWRRRYWNFLLKLAKNKPSWTLTAQPGPATGPFHWDNRHLSSQELAAIQTFPADFEILGNRAEAQRQLGNAVPSALAECVALKMRSRFFGDKTCEATRPTLIPDNRTDCPKPKRPRQVPEKYLDSVGSHSAHPGTGKGYGAIRLQNQQA